MVVTPAFRQAQEGALGHSGEQVGHEVGAASVASWIQRTSRRWRSSAPGELEVDSSTPLRPRVVNDLRKASQKRMAQKTLHHFSQMKAPSRESRRRQALNLLLPTFVRGRRGGSAWPGGLRFGRRGYSEHRMLLVTRLPLYCTAPRQLRILPLLDERDSIPILISDDRFSTIPAVTSDPRWCVEWCRGACPIWTPERGSSSQIAFTTWGRKIGPQ